MCSVLLLLKHNISEQTWCHFSLFFCRNISEFSLNFVQLTPTRIFLFDATKLYNEIIRCFYSPLNCKNIFLFNFIILANIFRCLLFLFPSHLPNKLSLIYNIFNCGYNLNVTHRAKFVKIRQFISNA